MQIQLKYSERYLPSTLDVPPVSATCVRFELFFVYSEKAAAEPSWRAPVYDVGAVSQSVGAGWRGLRPWLCFVPVVV